MKRLSAKQKGGRNLTPDHTYLMKKIYLSTLGSTHLQMTPDHETKMSELTLKNGYTLREEDLKLR